MGFFLESDKYLETMGQWALSVCWNWPIRRQHYVNDDPGERCRVLTSRAKWPDHRNDKEAFPTLCWGIQKTSLPDTLVIICVIITNIESSWISWIHECNFLFTIFWGAPVRRMVLVYPSAACQVSETPAPWGDSESESSVRVTTEGGQGTRGEGCDLGSGGFMKKTIEHLTTVRSTQDKESSISILILLHRNVGMLVFKLGLKVCCQGVICWNRRHLLSFRI